MQDVLTHAQTFAPVWHISDLADLCTFKEYVPMCKLLLVDQNINLYPLLNSPSLENLHNASTQTATRKIKKHNVSPLVLVRTLDSSVFKEEPVCYVLAANNSTLCYFLCAPAALKLGFIPHVFVEITSGSGGGVKRVFARTNRVRSHAFKLLKTTFQGTRPVVHVTENTWEATATRGLTISKFGETDGLSFRTRAIDVKLNVLNLDQLEEAGFMSYKGSWAGGPCFNIQNLLTLQGEEDNAECTEPETTVANWELAYLILVALVYLSIMIIMVANAFIYLKK